MNNKNKLKSLRINLLDYIYKVWYNDTINTKKIIEIGFQKAGIRNNFYLTDDEEKIRESYMFTVLNGILEIEDDLGNELNVNPEEENELEDIIEENMNDDINSDIESEQNYNEEGTIKNGENVEKENNIKNYIEKLGKNFKAFNEDKMDLDFFMNKI
jgi:type I site-specific restriction endonuclease